MTGPIRLSCLRAAGQQILDLATKNSPALQATLQKRFPHMQRNPAPQIVQISDKEMKALCDRNFERKLQEAAEKGRALVNSSVKS
jgi:hypothetical protein